jgi:DNA (cytosine-5)-methyltransferase 1
MKKRILSLFSGCGGMDIGFEGGFKILRATLNTKIHAKWIESEDEKYYHLKETAFETVFANDIRKDAKVAWDNFFSKQRSKEMNGTFKVESIVDIVKEYKKGNKSVLPKNIDIVTGGFPCQDFSVAGKRKGFNSHKNHKGVADDNIASEETRGKLYMWMKEVIEITSPKIFIAENVKGLANLGEVKSIIQNDFSGANGNDYIVLDPQVLHAGNFGIPQSRERIFFIGIKKSALKESAIKHLQEKEVNETYSPYPTATHRINGEMHYTKFADLMDPFVGCGQVLQDLEEPIKSKDLSQTHYSKAKFMGKHCQGQKEVNLNKLAPTIRAEHHGNIEFRRLSTENGGKYLHELDEGTDERRLTLRECARIQTFPDDYEFVIKPETSKKYLLSDSNAYKLVGNAVPPLLAYHLAKKIERNWGLYFN